MVSEAVIHVGRQRHPRLLAVLRMIVAIGAYELALFGTSVLLFFAGLRLVPAAVQATFGLISLGVAEGVAALSVILVWQHVDHRRVIGLGLRPEHRLALWARGAGAAALMMGFIVLAWYTLLDGAVWSLNPDASRASVVLVGGLLGFLVQGPAEEILFRGHLLENIRNRWGPWRAVGATSLAFALFHSLNPAFGVLPFINLVLFGVAAALYKLRIDRGQLWGVFGLHTIWNWLQQVVFGLPNSGIASTPDAALFTVLPNESLPGLIWGDGFGPEGTLAATLVLLALVGVCLRRGQRQRSS